MDSRHIEMFVLEISFPTVNINLIIEHKLNQGNCLVRLKSHSFMDLCYNID